jgi:hypothetical protein
MKLTSRTLVSPSADAFEDASGPSSARCRKRRTSQLELAPSTLVSRTREASGGRARYGSRRGGMRDDTDADDMFVSFWRV